MGVTGATIAWQRTETLWGWHTFTGSVLFRLGSLIFLFIFIVYLSKSLLYAAEVKKEFKNISKFSFSPTITISLLLLSIAAMNLYPSFSQALWILGTISHFFFSITVISIWIRHPSLEINHISPAWFIPVVGNILVPVAGVTYAPVEISWFFFSIGLIFWIALFTILLYRLTFHNPLPERLLPTLFIMIAPPAVGFIAHVKLTGTIDPPARLLYYLALFVFILMIPQLRMLSRTKYYLSWWAYTFPVAALTIATIRMYNFIKYAFSQYLALSLLILFSGILILLTVMTITAMKNKKICIED